MTEKSTSRAEEIEDFQKNKTGYAKRLRNLNRIFVEKLQLIRIMEINIREFIHEEIEKSNALFQRGASISKKEFKPFTFADYTYLDESQEYFGKFSVPYFLSFSILKDLENRMNNPYLGAIWYWKKDSDPDKTIGFLPMQSKLMYDTLESYVSLLKSEKFLQALILFRSYIEYSSQLYASILDYDFFQKYTTNENLDENFKQLWFNSLKPSKVLTKIKSMHKEINQLLNDEKLFYTTKSFYMRIFHPFDSELRGMLYSSLSSLAHGSYSALVKNNDVKLYALVWLCTIYLVESHVIIDQISSVYFKYSPKELFQKWTTLGIVI